MISPVLPDKNKLKFFLPTDRNVQVTETKVSGANLEAS